MAPSKRSTARGSRRSEAAGKKAGKGAKGSRDINAERRKQYRNNVALREKTKQRMRDNYRIENPKAPSALVDGLLAEGKYKEVVLQDLPESAAIPIYMTVFTLKDTADALGKTVITIKRWIADELIPPPRWVCTAHGYLHYTEQELKLIAKVLVEHEQEYDYFHHTHTKTINRVWQRVQRHRDQSLL